MAMNETFTKGKRRRSRLSSKSGKTIATSVQAANDAWLVLASRRCRFNLPCQPDQETLEQRAFRERAAAAEVEIQLQEPVVQLAQPALAQVAHLLLGALDAEGR